MLTELAEVGQSNGLSDYEVRRSPPLATTDTTLLALVRQGGRKTSSHQRFRGWALELTVQNWNAGAPELDAAAHLHSIAYTRQPMQPKLGASIPTLRRGAQTFEPSLRVSCAWVLGA